MDLLSELQHAEFKEAFDEFDKVSHFCKLGSARQSAAYFVQPFQDLGHFYALCNNHE